MTMAEKCLQLVEDLPPDYTKAVIAKLRSANAPLSFPNPRYSGIVKDFLRDSPGPANEIAAMLEVAILARKHQPSIDLVWTGPTTSVLPVRGTEQVLLEIIRGAREHLTILSFGLFQVPRVLAQFEDALSRGVKARIVLGEREEQLEVAQSRQKSQLGRVTMGKALVYHWPPERRSRDDLGRAGLMHVKAAVADGKVLLISSANLTGDGLERNMELGLLISNGHAARQVEQQVDALVNIGHLMLSAGE
ncbi:MAG: DISARM system phospholipase D-like protein DrmC [Bryobacteraceae bacterium]